MSTELTKLHANFLVISNTLYIYNKTNPNYTESISQITSTDFSIFELSYLHGNYRDLDCFCNLVISNVIYVSIGNLLNQIFYYIMKLQQKQYINMCWQFNEHNSICFCRVKNKRSVNNDIFIDFSIKNAWILDILHWECYSLITH